MASGSRFPSTVIFNLARSSMLYFPSITCFKPPIAYFDSTSARKPMPPELIAKIGLSTPCKVQSIVPSPPSTTTISDFLLISSKEHPFIFVSSAKLFSAKTSPFSIKKSYTSFAREIVLFAPGLHTRPHFIITPHTVAAFISGANLFKRDGCFKTKAFTRLNVLISSKL